MSDLGARLFIPAPVSDLGPITHTTTRRDTGTETELYLGPAGAPFIVFHTLAGFDALIGVLVAAKAGHGAALARHEALEDAAEPVPYIDSIEYQPHEDVPRPQAVESVPAVAPPPGLGDLHRHTRVPAPLGYDRDGEPVPVLPHRQPGAALAQAAPLDVPRPEAVPTRQLLSSDPASEGTPTGPGDLHEPGEPERPDGVYAVHGNTTLSWQPLPQIADQEPLPVLPHRQPGAALAQAEAAGRTVYPELAPETLAATRDPELWPEGDTP